MVSGPNIINGRPTLLLGGREGDFLTEGGQSCWGLWGTCRTATCIGVVPQDWRRGLVTPIHKGKGDQKDCDNHRGIPLLSVPSKDVLRLYLNRIRDHLVLTQRPEQRGLTHKRSTIDQILGLWDLIEGYLEYQRGFLAAYVDFKGVRLGE